MTSNAVSAVEFPGAARIHMGLAVADLERSTRPYETLFGQPPSKQREGYAKFEPTDPSVNLSLSQTSLDHGAKALPAHYGIQVKSSTAVAEAVERFRAAGMTPRRGTDRLLLRRPGQSLGVGPGRQPVGDLRGDRRGLSRAQGSRFNLLPG